MSTKETRALPVIVLPQENNRKKSAGQGKTKKTTEIPNTLHVGIHDFVLPPSDSMQLARISIQIQIIKRE